VSEQIRRAVALLDELARGEPSQSIRSLAETTGLSKSAVQRSLASLVEVGLAEKHHAGSYALGPRTLVLGTAYRRRIDLRAVAVPVMTRLRDVTGETVGLSMPVGDEIIHVEQVESRSELRRTFEIGRPLPLWCGAPSRVLLAARGDDEVRRIAHDRAGAGITPAAPPPPDELLRLVGRCRADGYAAALGETIGGVNTLALAIYDAHGDVHATLSITGPATRWDQAAMTATLTDSRDAARELSRALGASG
jgi:DNA-binding IclR family transcriptional regulator